MRKKYGFIQINKHIPTKKWGMGREKQREKESNTDEKLFR